MGEQRVDGADQIGSGEVRRVERRGTGPAVVGWLVAGSLALPVWVARALAACRWARAAVELTQTSQVINSAASATCCSRATSALMCHRVASGGTARVDDA